MIFLLLLHVPQCSNVTATQRPLNVEQSVQFNRTLHVGMQHCSDICPRLLPQRLQSRSSKLHRLQFLCICSNTLLAGMPHLLCLSLRGLTVLHPTDYSQLLYAPQLRALDLYGMTRSEDQTGLFLGKVLAKMQNLKVCPRSPTACLFILLETPADAHTPLHADAYKHFSKVCDRQVHDQQCVL